MCVGHAVALFSLFGFQGLQEPSVRESRRAGVRALVERHSGMFLGGNCVLGPGKKVKHPGTLPIISSLPGQVNPFAHSIIAPSSRSHCAQRDKCPEGGSLAQACVLMRAM